MNCHDKVESTLENWSSNCGTGNLSVSFLFCTCAYFPLYLREEQKFGLEDRKEIIFLLLIIELESPTSVNASSKPRQEFWSMEMLEKITVYVPKGVTIFTTGMDSDIN